MPKIKTRKTAVKRFKLTKGGSKKGKIKTFKKGNNHLRSKKSNRRLNRMKGTAVRGETAKKALLKATNIT